MVLDGNSVAAKGLSECDQGHNAAKNMKAQRRHELKENDLSHALEVARDYLDKHGKTLVMSVVIVGAVAAAVGLTVQSRSTAREDRWRRRADLAFTDPQVGRESLATLSTLIQDAPDDFALASLIEQGHQALRLSLDVNVPPDRELTATAKTAFHQLLARFGDNQLAVGAAHLGLATVEENEFALDGDPTHRTEVEKHLAAVIDAPSLDGMPFKGIAMKRRDELDETFKRITFAEPQPVEADPAVAEPADAAPAPPAVNDAPANNAPADDAGGTD